MRVNDMQGRLAACLFGLGLLTPAAASQLVAHQPMSVCVASANAPKLAGKRIRVEGYIFDLSSHGFVLASKRSCQSRGQLGLLTNRVHDTQVWRGAFAKSMGPKRAVLIGVVQWRKARDGGGQVPVLAVERVESIAAREADLNDF
jgi:hypothetical protein